MISPKTINFEHPDYIPVNLVVNDSIYFRYDPDEIAELQESHPIIAGKHTIRYDLFERRRQSRREKEKRLSGMRQFPIIVSSMSSASSGKRPSLSRDYIKPSCKRLMKPARDFGAIIHMHTDGDICALTDDLVDGGVDLLNLQDLVNGLDWIRDRFAGKTCVDLDIDRQKITVFGTPAEVDALICEKVEKLSSPAGGLMLTFGWYAGTPIENIRALMDALEKYMFRWS